MTLTSDKWKVKTAVARDDPRVTQIAGDLDILVPTAQLLVSKGYSDTESARRFIEKSTEMLHDPFLMKDMKKAAARLISAVDAGEKIVIYGDYDVDGVTSVSCLYLFLSGMGAKVGYYIPERSGEGYGMSCDRVRTLAGEGVTVIVTVDTGITALAEADTARECGVDLIVTDHHECHDTIPDAYAVVNPHRPDCPYPFKDLAGVGVVFKLLTAIELLRGEGEPIDAIRRICDEYIDLVAIGTVADVMPVMDENRLIVAQGLSILEKRPRLAIRELMNAISNDQRKNTKKKMTSNFIGFTIAPRINAAGRIASASLAVEMFISDDTEKVGRLAAELCEINKRRQAEENSIVEEAKIKIAERYGDLSAPIILLSDESWHHGVIGIVASRITEKYGVPSILVSFEGSSGEERGDDVGKGSGRSVKGMNLVDALCDSADLLEKFGGHELAAGLSVRRDKLEEFRSRLEKYASEHLNGASISPTLEADVELSPEDITKRQAQELSLLEPYGVGNQTPVFILRDVEVVNALSVGEGRHSRLTVRCPGGDVTAMCFRTALEELDVFPGDRVDIAFNLDLNEYQNSVSVQLIVREISPCAKQLEEIYRRDREYRRALEQAMNGEECSVTLFREQIGEIYNMIRSELRLGHEVFTVRSLLRIASAQKIDTDYVRLRLTLEVFAQLGLLGTVTPKGDGGIYRFHLDGRDSKTELENSVIYRALGERE